MLYLLSLLWYSEYRPSGVTLLHSPLPDVLNENSIPFSITFFTANGSIPLNANLSA
ncbi:hypothetical protein SCLCIDRAFT_1211741 [Scleroderma citrinum Foug A]|uniref:Uncharacterized protein n=1 Tax=Scleroderma citrinum Foug A TaxID=1036808 RepID=A0A0C3ECT7_9AGAM|nr:hypothetical protein SCLCIDRAFT_1211741 [Scleroderma citrinum Foug A]